MQAVEEIKFVSRGLAQFLHLLEDERVLARWGNGVPPNEDGDGDTERKEEPRKEV